MHVHGAESGQLEVQSMTYGEESTAILEFLNKKEKTSDEKKIHSASVLIDENDSLMSVVYPTFDKDKNEVFKMVLYKNIKNKFTFHM